MLPMGCLRQIVIPLALLLGRFGSTAHAKEPDREAKVHRAFNDLYPAAFRTKVNASLVKGCRWLLGA